MLCHPRKQTKKNKKLQIHANPHAQIISSSPLPTNGT
jgi:hypothetical protein